MAKHALWQTVLDVTDHANGGSIPFVPLGAYDIIKHPEPRASSSPRWEWFKTGMLLGAAITAAALAPFCITG